MNARAAGTDTLCSRLVEVWLSRSQKSGRSQTVSASTVTAASAEPAVRSRSEAASAHCPPLLDEQLQIDLLAGTEIPHDVRLGQPDGLGHGAQAHVAYSGGAGELAGGGEDGLAPLLLVLRPPGPEECRPCHVVISILAPI
ncbi:hypothetical protein GCM10020220_084480 [Nonomuraea rubra]